MTTPIPELSLEALLEEAKPSFDSTEAEQWAETLRESAAELVELRREVTIATARVSEAEYRTNAKPAHWQEAHGELVRLRKALNEAEGEALFLRAELERRVRRVRTGGGK